MPLEDSSWPYQKCLHCHHQFTVCLDKVITAAMTLTIIVTLNARDDEQKHNLCQIFNRGSLKQDLIPDTC